LSCDVILVLLLATDRAGHCSGNTLYLYTGGTLFASRPWQHFSEFPLRLDYGRSLHAYVDQRLQIQLELLMMSDIPLETCWAF